ncbi:MAG: helix-turn-helix transcriptional regulator [Pseudomonadota bacterium]
MTPFGLRLRELREKKGVNQKEMAEGLGISPAYLSALEHGHRGVPSWQMLQRIIGYFNIIWDEAEELEKMARQSHTRVTVDTRHLSADATRLANLLAGQIEHLSELDCRVLISEINRRTRR